MQIYLPIAEMSVNALYILALGCGVGMLSGLFGVGGGFLTTPLLIFLGIPPSISVATQANQLMASSVSGVLAHWRRKAVDFKIGWLMVLGGTLGSVLGVLIFRLLSEWGQIDLVISFSYVLLLGIIGVLMLYESLKALRKSKDGKKRRKRRKGNFLQGLPWKMRFPASRLYVSAYLPAGIGFLGGLLVSVMGIGGGFLMVPAMVYLLGMPARLVPGTSLFQIIFASAISTFLHAVTNHTVDLVLGALLIVGGVIGAQVGSGMGGKLKPEVARFLLAMILLGVAYRLLLELVVQPAEIYTIGSIGGG